MIKTKPTPPPVETPKPNRNLLLLGIISIGIATITTAVSIFIYHKTGDIYLDRSRPGFLPDEDETKADQEKAKDFNFSSSGSIDPEILQEYLDNYQSQLDALDKLEKPFSSTPLSDASLGI